MKQGNSLKYFVKFFRSSSIQLSLRSNQSWTNVLLDLSQVIPNDVGVRTQLDTRCQSQPLICKLVCDLKTGLGSRTLFTAVVMNILCESSTSPAPSHTQLVTTRRSLWSGWLGDKPGATVECKYSHWNVWLGIFYENLKSNPFNTAAHPRVPALVAASTQCCVHTSITHLTGSLQHWCNSPLNKTSLRMDLIKWLSPLQIRTHRIIRHNSGHITYVHRFHDNRITFLLQCKLPTLTAALTLKDNLN